jgi:alpha-beta hydrolase superfamily lysophospholipase
MSRRWSAPALALAAALLLSGCAHMAVQQPDRPPEAFAGPRLEEGAMVSFDGARLGLTRWTPEGDKPWAVIVGLHGIDDYANAFHLAAPYWARDGIATYALDQRGFGRSPQRGIWAGEGLMTEDLRTLTALVRRRYPAAIVAVAGESMGGAVAIEAFASDQPPDADRLVLLSPAVWGWSTQPIPYKTALWVTAHVAPGAVLQAPAFVYRHIHASDNIAELRRMGRDPLMMFGARTDELYGLVSLMEHASRDVRALKVPTAYLAGVHDQIVTRGPTMKAAARLPPQDRTAYYPDGWHLLLIDLHAETVWKDVESFLRDPAAPLPSGAPPIQGASSAYRPGGGSGAGSKR